LSNVYFEPDEQGLDLFSAYLRSFRNEPVRLLVDLIEEEFRQIKIPLLRGSDRQAILKRNYVKYFRNSEYKFSISQSVERKARKEEKVLIMGLTNQYLLEPWLKIIDETSTPLSGILSLPLVSEEYIKEFKAEQRAVILVSQQVPSNLRQSVFIDGKLFLSRLVPIASFYQGDYASDVLRDVESTQRYLISQRIVELGGIDTCYGGIGYHGHLAFNEPPISRWFKLTPDEFRDSLTRIVPLAPETIVMNSIRATGGNPAVLPPMAVTLGMGDILRARRLRLYCQGGEWQRTVLRIALLGEEDVDYPVTLAQGHPDYVIVTDENTAQPPLPAMAA
jgi:6-phosphogluconolactonase/glucosamine-6-phosphate isomerase/deaminase